MTSGPTVSNGATGGIVSALSAKLIAATIAKGSKKNSPSHRKGSPINARRSHGPMPVMGY
jgi:hypothetical protein